MSWEASAWAMKKGKDYELEPTARFVMLSMANYADKEGNDIYPSLATLEADTGLSERTIRRHIKHLIAVGLLEYGDQTIVSNNPRFRGDKLPKVYRFRFEVDGQPRGVDFGNFGRMPSAKHKAVKAPAAPPEERADTVTGGTQCHERPDTVSGATGQTGGHSVHQTYKPPSNPLGQPVQSEPSPEEIEAGKRLREQARARLALKGTWAQKPALTSGERETA